MTNPEPPAPDLAGQTVVVTGASGFIGTHLCRRLVVSGAEVHGVSRRPPDADSDPIRWTQTDLADLDAVRRYLRERRPSLIFHLASHVIGLRALEVVPSTFTAGLVSTVNLLTAATEIGGARLVIAGSMEEPDPGDAAPIPVSPYAAAKWASSGYARMFHALYDTPVVIARLFMVYGPAQRDLDKLVPYTCLALLRGESPRLSSGARPVDWLYVDDAVSGLTAAATAPSVEGQTIDLGSGELVTIRALAEMLARIIGGSGMPLFGALPDRPRERVCVANVEESRRRIGWQPIMPLAEGLRRTVAWYRSLVA